MANGTIIMEVEISKYETVYFDERMQLKFLEEMKNQAIGKDSGTKQVGDKCYKIFDVNAGGHDQEHEEEISPEVFNYVECLNGVIAYKKAEIAKNRK